MHLFIRSLCVLAGLICPLLASAANQTVTFAPVSTVGLGVSPITLTATSNSGLTAFTYATTSATSICTVAGDKLTVTGVGICALTANQAGDANFAAASATASVNVVASQATVTLIAVQSRKTHGAAGTYDVPIDVAPVAGAVTVEPRAVNAGHSIVFQFSGPVTSVRSVSAVDAFANTQAASLSVAASEVTVGFTSVSDNNSLRISLLGVNDAVDQVISAGFLVGDTNNSRSVNASDISGVKARSGQATTGSNFRFDVNASGSINSSDISTAKARSGLVLPVPVVRTAPTITSGAPPNGIVGRAYSFTFAATGTAPIRWTVTAGMLPAGLTLNANSGVLSGTPNAQGSPTFTVQAANGTLPNATSALTVVVNPDTFITSGAPPVATVSFAYSHTFTAAGLQPITWSVTAGTLPAWATLNANTGVFSGTPTSAGNFSFTVTATSTVAAANQAVALTVNPPVAPTITSGTPLGIGSINQFYSFTFAATGTSPISWSLASGSLPPGLTLSPTGVLSGTPTTAGLSIFSVQAANGVLPNAVSANAAIKVTTTDVSTDGVTLPNVSKFAFIIPPERVMPLLNGAGQEVNAYPMNPARCATTPPLTRSWQHNIDLADYKGKNAFDFFEMPANQALSYKFTVGIDDAAGGFIYNDASNARVRPTFISITQTPCNFDVTKLEPGPNRDPCFSTGINGQGVNWANITTELPASYCRLVKGTTYYLNLRFQDGRPVSEGGSPTTDSCTGVGNCGGIIQIL